MKVLLFASCLFLPAAAATITADYSSLPDGCAASVSQSGTTVTGSANVCHGTFASVAAIGVVGGGADSTLDLNESMTVTFGGLVSNVVLNYIDVDPPGNVFFSVQAFSGATDLGISGLQFASANPTALNISNLFSGQSISSFGLTVSSSAPIGLQILSVDYDAQAVPEPGTFALLGLGLGALAFVRSRRS